MTLTVTRMEQLETMVDAVTQAIAGHVWTQYRMARRKVAGEFIDTNHTIEPDEQIQDALGILICELCENGKSIDSGTILRASLDAGTLRKRPWNPAKDNDQQTRHEPMLVDPRTLLVAAHNSPHAPNWLQAMADEASTNQTEPPSKPHRIDRETPDTFWRVLTAHYATDPVTKQLRAYCEV